MQIELKIIEVANKLSETAEIASWTTFKLFKPKLSPNRLKNGRHYWKKTSKNVLKLLLLLF